MKNTFCFNPSSPDSIKSIAEVSEVFPGTDAAVLAIMARRIDGSWLVWACRKEERQPCSEPQRFTDEAAARAAHAMLVSDILRYAYPDAAA